MFYLGCDVHSCNHPNHLLDMVDAEQMRFICARFASNPFKCRVRKSAEGDTHFVGYVLNESGCSRQVAFQIWSGPKRHIRTSQRMLWRPRVPKVPLHGMQARLYTMVSPGYPKPRPAQTVRIFSIVGPMGALQKKKIKNPFKNKSFINKGL